MKNCLYLSWSHKFSPLQKQGTDKGVLVGQLCYKIIARHYCSKVRRVLIHILHIVFGIRKKHRQIFSSSIFVENSFVIKQVLGKAKFQQCGEPTKTSSAGASVLKGSIGRCMLSSRNKCTWCMPKGMLIYYRVMVLSEAKCKRAENK